MLTDSLLARFIEILKHYEPEKIILFGSRARGESDNFSDYDIVVIKKTDRPFLDRMQDMVPYLVQFDRPADILVYTPEEFDRMQETGLGWMIHKASISDYRLAVDSFCTYHR